MSNQSDLIEIAALWKNESKTGRKYLSGRMGNARLLVFFETEKKSDKAPDARIFVAPNTDRQGSGQGQGQGQGYRGQGNGTSPEQRREQSQQARSGAPVKEDDIPF